MEDLEPIKVKIIYEGSVRNITKKDCEEAVVSKGLEFVNFLGFVFSSYPNIEKIFPPGSISLLLNNRPPQTRDILKDGDIIKISA